MLTGAPVTQFVAIDSVSAEVRVSVRELEAALREAKVTGVAVPQSWDGIVLSMNQDKGVLADYGDFFIAEAPPLTIGAPATFPLERFVDILLRIVGINARDALTLSESFKDVAMNRIVPTDSVASLMRGYPWPCRVHAHGYESVTNPNRSQRCVVSQLTLTEIVWPSNPRRLLAIKLGLAWPLRFDQENLP